MNGERNLMGESNRHPLGFIEDRNFGVGLGQQPPATWNFQAADTVGVFADEFDQDASNSEDEGIEDYVKGGYHPVFRGEVLNGRYVILQKLGWGHFSTVWLSRDTKFNTYVAIKIQKSESRYLEAAFDEVEILQKAVKQSHNPEWLKDLQQIYKDPNRKFESDDCHVVQLLNAFIYQGPYGRHFCMVFEILGVNLLEIIKRYDYKGIPLPLCKEISKQVLIGLHYLHKYCGIIHTDLKPENVMVCLNADELKEIVESGQLNNNKRIEARLNLIKEKIKRLNGEEGPVAEQVHNIEEPSVEDSGVHGPRFERSESERESTNEGLISRGVRITTEDELNREFETICSIRNITNRNDKKNLKKRLKKKLKMHQKNELKGFKGSMRAGMDVPTHDEKKASARIKVTDNPIFTKSGLRDNFRIKIADLGNGCWTHHHFQPEIQTRQYRSPETILGINYNETCDIWSFACMLFEMLTGEFLFDPRKNPQFSKSTDHLRLMMEMLNRFPKDYSTVGTQSKKFVDANGNFKKVADVNFKTMKDILVKRYRTCADQAESLQHFLLPMLAIFPQTRISAFESLKDDWLTSGDNEHFFRPTDEDGEAAEFDPVLDLPDEFKRIVDEEEFDADKSNVSNLSEELETKEDLEFQHHYYEREIKFFDRNFKNVYVGYADGIDLNHLDNTANWQFESKHH